MEFLEMGDLYYGDNLLVMRTHIADESVDLIYLDPPFKSNANYNVLFKSPTGEPSVAQAGAFLDTWEWGPESRHCFEEVMASGSPVAGVLKAMRDFLGENPMMAYLANMAARMIEMHRVLKPTGSLYLHCDPSASHYLKVLLDGAFKPECFRNEIIWRRSAAHNKLSRKYGPIHDTLLFFTKSDDFFFELGYTPYTKQYLSKNFRHSDSGGSYRLNELTGAGAREGDSGKSWHSYNPTDKGRHWAVPRSLRYLLPNGGKDMTVQQQLDVIDGAGAIVFSGDGRPTYKQRPGEGTSYQDIWAYQAGTEGILDGIEECIDSDVKWLDSEQERLGYPTQKPMGLLHRIINTSSRPGDVVLDPFCGCGTSVHAAQSLGRNWIGIDVTHYAIALIQQRLEEQFSSLEINVVGRPVDLAGARRLAKDDPRQFQWWATWRLGVSVYNEVPDRGVNGLIFFRNGPFGTGKVVVAVTTSDNPSPGKVREVLGMTERDTADLGMLITLNEPTRKMNQEANAAGMVKTAHGKFPRVQIATIKDLLGDRYPQLPPQFTVHSREEMRRAGGAAKALADQRKAQLSFRFPIPGGNKKKGRKRQWLGVDDDALIG